MIRVLVMANESLLANFIVSSLSQQPDLDVFRVTRDEVGARRDYSIVIVIDEEMDETETIKLKEIIRGERALLLVRVSLKSRNVYVDESYQLVNPGIARMVDLLREFGPKTQQEKSAEDMDSQKKMISVRPAQASKYKRQQTHSSLGRTFALSQIVDFHRHLTDTASDSSQREIPLFFYSFFLQYLRLQNPKNVTLPTWQEYATGSNR